MSAPAIEKNENSKAELAPSLLSRVQGIGAIFRSKILIRKPKPSKLEDQGGPSDEKRPPQESPKKNPRKNQVIEGLIEIGKALFAPDSKTRRMALLFFVGMLGLLGVICFEAHRLVERHQLERAQERHWEKVRLRQEAQYEREVERAKDRTRWADFGLFSAEVKPDPAHPQNPVSLNKNLVDIAIQARCLNRETREYLDARQAQVRSEILSALAGTESDDFLTPIGKRRLKKRILDRLNTWVHGEYPKGKIEELFISDLAVR